MGADMKNLRLRIRSVDSTLHLTKAMELVASSKIRRANDAMFKSRDYAEAAGNMISLLSASPDCKRHPCFSVPGEGPVRLIVIAGDRGLCGGYNAGIFRLMREYPDAEVIPIGKRACEHYHQPIVSSEAFTRQEGYSLAAELFRDFMEGKFSRLGIVSTKYVSMMTQMPELTWLLPFALPEKKMQSGILFEPGEAEILEAAIPEYISGCILAAVRESFACEVAARRMAMDSAGKNAQQMISDLTLSYNRARQSAITQEITEIVAGSGG